MRKTGKVRARTAGVAVEAVEPPAEADGLWPIAMLRIAMELKRPGAPGLDEIIGGVVGKMGIPRAQFEKYLAEHLGALREAARKKGYAR